MKGSTGLRNFAENIKPVMTKIHENINPYGGSKKLVLSPSELNTIKEFYNEVCYVLGTNPEDKS